VAAWHEPRPDRSPLVVQLMTLGIIAAGCGLLGVILWRLWTEVLAPMPW
jgi:hypothetical protein